LLLLSFVFVLLSGRNAGAEPETDASVGKASAKDVAMVSEGPALVKQFKAFSVYSDEGSKENHFVPYGLMGDIGDVRINAACIEAPHAGKSCIKIVYTARSSRGSNWAGLFWQQPANNWGEMAKGFDLRGATRITFWARGEKGGEKISEFKTGGISGGDYADTDCASSGPVILTDKWKQYTIDLKDRDLSNIIGGFCWVASKDNNPNGFVIYLDDIIYE
jgi:hypothetical protein